MKYARFAQRIAILALLVLAVSSCNSTLLVRVEGPPGAMVKVGKSDPQAVPFNVKVDRRARVEIQLAYQSLVDIGLSSTDIDEAIKEDANVLTGVLSVRGSRDKFGKLILERDSLKKAVTELARFNWRWHDSYGHRVLVFEGRVKME